MDKQITNVVDMPTEISNLVNKNTADNNSSHYNGQNQRIIFEKYIL